MNELNYINQRLSDLKWLRELLIKNNQYDAFWEAQYQKQVLKLINRKIYIKVYGD